MTLHFRAPRLEDEAQATAAETELAAEGHTEFFRSEGEAWGDYIEREHRESAGVDLPEGRVRLPCSSRSRATNSSGACTFAIG